MPPVALTMKNVASGRRLIRPGQTRHEPDDPSNLGAASDRPEGQAMIRDAIRRGVIRVVPIPGSTSQVRVIRVQPQPPSPNSPDGLEF